MLKVFLLKDQTEVVLSHFNAFNDLDLNQYELRRNQEPCLIGGTKLKAFKGMSANDNIVLCNKGQVNEGKCIGYGACSSTGEQIKSILFIFGEITENVQFTNYILNCFANCAIKITFDQQISITKGSEYITSNTVTLNYLESVKYNGYNTCTITKVEKVAGEITQTFSMKYTQVSNDMQEIPYLSYWTTDAIPFGDLVSKVKYSKVTEKTMKTNEKTLFVAADVIDSANYDITVSYNGYDNLYMEKIDNIRGIMKQSENQQTTITRKAESTEHYGYQFSMDACYGIAIYGAVSSINLMYGISYTRSAFIFNTVPTKKNLQIKISRAVPFFDDDGNFHSGDTFTLGYNKILYFVTCDENLRIDATVEGETSPVYEKNSMSITNSNPMYNEEINFVCVEGDGLKFIKHPTEVFMIYNITNEKKIIVEEDALLKFKKPIPLSQYGILFEERGTYYIPDINGESIKSIANNNGYMDQEKRTITISNKGEIDPENKCWVLGYLALIKINGFIITGKTNKVSSETNMNFLLNDISTKESITIRAPGCTFQYKDKRYAYETATVNHGELVMIHGQCNSITIDNFASEDSTASISINQEKLSGYESEKGPGYLILKEGCKGHASYEIITGNNYKSINGRSDLFYPTKNLTYKDVFMIRDYSFISENTDKIIKPFTFNKMYMDVINPEKADGELGMVFKILPGGYIVVINSNSINYKVTVTDFLIYNLMDSPITVTLNKRVSLIFSDDSGYIKNTFVLNSKQYVTMHNFDYGELTVDITGTADPSKEISYIDRDSSDSSGAESVYLMENNAITIPEKSSNLKNVGSEYGGDVYVFFINNPGSSIYCSFNKEKTLDVLFAYNGNKERRQYTGKNLVIDCGKKPSVDVFVKVNGVIKYDDQFKLLYYNSELPTRRIVGVLGKYDIEVNGGESFQIVSKESGTVYPKDKGPSNTINYQGFSPSKIITSPNKNTFVVSGNAYYNEIIDYKIPEEPTVFIAKNDEKPNPNTESPTQSTGTNITQSTGTNVTQSTGTNATQSTGQSSEIITEQSSEQNAGQNSENNNLEGNGVEKEKLNIPMVIGCSSAGVIILIIIIVAIIVIAQKHKRDRRVENEVSGESSSEERSSNL